MNTALLIFLEGPREQKFTFEHEFIKAPFLFKSAEPENPLISQVRVMLVDIATVPSGPKETMLPV